MIYSNKYLKPHIFFKDQTFEEHCSTIPKFYFNKNVPDDVIKSFEVIEKLLAHSYFEYKFIDEAYAKAIHTFEMAMSIRHKDFDKKSKKLRFNALINKLYALNLFDTSLEVLKHIKDIRNHFSHPERHSFGGTVFWKRSQQINRLINEMYEDVELRLVRRTKSIEFIKNQGNSGLNKSLVLQVGGKKTILFCLNFLFLNNKQQPNIYLLAYVPLFNLDSENENTVRVPRIFKLKIINPKFDKTQLIAQDFNSKLTVNISSIDSHKELFPLFENWNQEFKNKKNNFLYELSMGMSYDDIINPELWAFYKME